MNSDTSHAKTYQFQITSGSSISKAFLLLLIAFLLMIPACSQGLDGVIAYYPLRTQSDDITQANDPIILTNAPFQGDGVYCNGLYINFRTKGACNIQTPTLKNFDFKNFSIELQFMTEDFQDMPVFVGGDSHRWIGYYLSADGSISMLYRNNVLVNCGGSYEINTWQNALITYDGNKAYLYLNDELLCSQEFELIHGDDKNVSVTNFSNGKVFHGFIRELKVYNKVISP